MKEPCTEDEIGSMSETEPGLNSSFGWSGLKMDKTNFVEEPCFAPGVCRGLKMGFIRCCKQQIFP
jgi:hypothetical protein